MIGTWAQVFPFVVLSLSLCFDMSVLCCITSIVFSIILFFGVFSVVIRFVRTKFALFSHFSKKQNSKMEVSIGCYRSSTLAISQDRQSREPDPSVYNF